MNYLFSFANINELLVFSGKHSSGTEPVSFLTLSLLDIDGERVLDDRPMLLEGAAWTISHVSMVNNISIRGCSLIQQAERTSSTCSVRLPRVRCEKRRVH